MEETPKIALVYNENEYIETSQFLMDKYNGSLNFFDDENLDIFFQNGIKNIDLCNDEKYKEIKNQIKNELLK